MNTVKTDMYGQELTVGSKIVIRVNFTRDDIRMRIATIDRFGTVGGEDVVYLKDVQFLSQDSYFLDRRYNRRGCNPTYRYCYDIIKIS